LLKKSGEKYRNRFRFSPGSQKTNSAPAKEEMMFGIKKQETLSGPKKISGIVEKYLASNYKWNPELMGIINMVLQKNPKAEKAYNCRIFDLSEAEARGIKVKDFSSLEGNLDLILYEGWFDETSKQVELTENKKIDFDIPLFTEAEVTEKITALSESNPSVFFYQARGPAYGGPLGRGAAVIELNPNNSDHKDKKYSIYTVNVIGKEPAGNKQKLFASNKPKEIANWVMNAHHKRLY
jgi:hypothetical protein